ncbi:type I 3-dehydroquinate dehydratase [Schnuerera sp. xch1]|uniref:type I 3-dehydroquinate dehydratase n=1 Tax=Schnuerera sp. xch1 TaxID=2874283 RepID=UPI001CBCC59D|nr:type I 3-dehydroquinate dehydratase [Schnuerera sp. xch1]MBZ2173992.1 type I 3-dehydroquinate dehydratase [Schnuerera sp. xch1]
MKLQSKKKVIVKNKVFGGSKMLICLPLISKNKEMLIKDAKEICLLAPDIIEWRVDFFETIHDINNIKDALIELSKSIDNIPLIFTLRHSDEGGCIYLTQDKRIEIIEKSINTGCVDLLDIEIANDMEFLNKIKNIIKRNDIKLILSYHNFKQTPSEEFMLNKIIEGEKIGADISKIAVMPKDYGDVLKLLNATYKARNIVDIPLITIAMGKTGAITRMIGGLFGSDMTFAVGKESSAAGQMPISDIKMVLNILSNSRTASNNRQRKEDLDE